MCGLGGEPCTVRQVTRELTAAAELSHVTYIGEMSSRTSTFDHLVGCKDKTGLKEISALLLLLEAKNN